MEQLQALKAHWLKTLLIGTGAVIVIFAILQFIPLDQTNPPVIAEPNWDSPETRALAERACFDCHSNETEWPWYSKVAPMRFLVTNHVNEGRETLNFSEWNRRYETDEIIEVIREGEMPSWDYVLLHGDAKLTDAEKEALIGGLRQTLAQS